MMKSGWILDSYPVQEGMCVWMIDEEGQAFSLFDSWSPYFYLRGEARDRDSVRGLLEAFHRPFSVRRVEKKDFFSGQSCDVVEVRVQDPLIYSRVVDRLLKSSSLTLFNADLNLVSSYFYERGVFPLARCAIEENAGVLRGWELLDSPLEMDYELPPLRYAHVGLGSVWECEPPESRADPNHKNKGGYLLTLGKELGKGPTYAMDESEEELLRSLRRHIDDWDPDIILTDWGDSYIMPRLQLYARRCDFALHLSRDPNRSISNRIARRFFSYGENIYQPGGRMLFGRLHIDTRNSFVVSHTDLDGLFEIGRVAKMPLQRAARSTIGTSLSSMQHEWAVRNDFLIPMDKGQTEDFRPAAELIRADRGGLVYEPETGWHEDLVEFDFASMYPEIMVRHNVTPEAINCACCPDNKVPEIGHHICRNRKGMVPAVLGPLIEKRRLYKEFIRRGHPKKASFRCRYDALKWALVTCFGYLGFRNARFGKIEAHECVNAFSREALLRAKEVAEEEGFHFIHAIVDSLWIKKRGASNEDVEALRQKIEKATGLPLGLEGRYKWIYFCPSRRHRDRGVPGRYVGAFRSGETKVRGLELRRHDTPLVIKSLQEKLIAKMAEADSVAKIREQEDLLKEIVNEYRERIRKRRATPFELAIGLRLSREPGEYVHGTLSAIAAKKLAASGVQLHRGETIQYIVTKWKDKVADWRVTPLAFIDETFEYDPTYYEQLLNRAIEILPRRQGET